MVIEFSRVVVREGAVNRAAQAGAVDEACVAEAIEEDDIILAGQRLQGADARGRAAAEGEGGFGAFEGREFFLQFGVRSLRAGDQAGGTRARAVIAGRADGGLDDIAVRGESEIIIGGEVVQRFACDRHGGARRRIGYAQRPPQAAAFQVVQ